MYQYWSGRVDREGEIAKIREAAKRGLKKHPDAISLYWNRYPIGEGWKSYEDVFRREVFWGSEQNNELYMPLENLISVTKEANIKDPEVLRKLAFWGGSSITIDPRFKEVRKLKEDRTTLKSVLLERGFLLQESAPQ